MTTSDVQRTRSTYDNENHIYKWLNSRSVNAVQKRTEFLHSAELNQCRDWLRNESRFAQGEVEEYLTAQDWNKCNKKELLYRNWHKQVYQPICRNIRKVVDSPRIYNRQDLFKRENFMNFLEHRNVKGHVFLDEFDPVEYNPLRGRTSALIHKQVVDPVLRETLTRNDEDRTEIRCMTGISLGRRQLDQVRLPRVPLSRDEIECWTWGEMPLQNVDSGVRAKSRRRMNRARLSNEYDYRGWNGCPAKANGVSEMMDEYRPACWREEPVDTADPKLKRVL